MAGLGVAAPRQFLWLIRPGARILKTALAVALAWWLCQALGQPRPIFAALAALQAVRPTIAASLKGSLGQLLGMSAGLILAALTSSVVRQPGPLELGLVVLLALLATVRLGLIDLLGTEVAVTTLLSFALAHGETAWGLDRLWEAGLGGAVAISINALVLPPNYLADALLAVDSLQQRVIDYTRQAVADLLAPPPPSIARGHLLAARDAVSASADLSAQTRRASEALAFSPWLRFSPLHSSTRSSVERCARGVEVLAAMLVHARTAARAAWQASRKQASPLAEPSPWLTTAEALAAAVRAFATYLELGTPDSLGAARATLDAARHHYTYLVVSQPPAVEAPWERDRAAFLSELEHLLDDLAGGLRAEEQHLPPTAEVSADQAPVPDSGGGG